MGEIAEDIIDGYCCQCCGDYFEKPTGYPTVCDLCIRENKQTPQKKKDSQK